MQLFFDDDSRELQILNEEFLTESGNKEKVYKIKGIFSTIGEKNRNGRVYPREIWEEQVLKVSAVHFKRFYTFFDGI